MLPPWEKYPDLEYGDLGWRMGYGEEYLDAFREWWVPLPPPDKRDYAGRYPPPSHWEGFFSDIDSV